MDCKSLQSSIDILKQKQSIIKIYTDWANHYLERRATNSNLTKSISVSNPKLNAGPNRCIADLTTDLQDGVLLIEIVESVTNTRLTASKIYTKPKNSSQMIDNIEACLQFLHQLGVNLEGITANDVFDGNLKSILSLFFNLSRYKQAVKARQQMPAPQHSLVATANRRPAPSVTPTLALQLSRIPKNGSPQPRSGSPASSLIRHPTHTPQPPPQTTHPTPPQSTTTASAQPPNQTTTQIPAKGIRAPRPVSTSSIPGPSASTKTSVILRTKNSGGSNPQSTQTIVDKIKHYNKSGQQTVNNDKSIPQIVANTSHTKAESTLSKRTSSSSGFSSAKSDSSASVCGETSASPVVANTTTAKIKSGVNSNQTAAKSQTSNCQQSSANTAINSNTNNNSNINSGNNSSNSQTSQKRNEEIVANCENIKINGNNNNGNKSVNPSAKSGSIPVKRTIQPPRSRPTSTIIDNSVAMASSSHSMSTTPCPSFNTIAKPTAAVKGTSKVLPHDDSSGNGSAIASTKSDKPEGESLGASEHTLQANSSKMKSTSDKTGSQTQVSTINPKPEPSIAMVSPIMARDKKCKTIEEEKCTDDRKQVTSKLMNNVSKKSDKQVTDHKKTEPLNNGQTPPEMQDSVSSSHGEGEESASNSDVDSTLVNIKPMPPLSRTSQFAFLRSNVNQLSNGVVYQRFPNNYSSIENGYMSDCANSLVNSNARPVYRGCYSVAGSTTGYMSETDGCASHIKRNQLLCAKADQMSGATHRHYNDTDSPVRATNLFDFMHPKHITSAQNTMSSNSAHFPQHCLDDSSSLSSDAGMISGTEASGTTTTSSMSSAGGDPYALHHMPKSGAKSASKSSSKSKSNGKKTDSSMQTEAMAAANSSAAWKRYLHEHHLMIKGNNTVAPKTNSNTNANVDDGTKSLDRLEARLNGSNTSLNKKVAINSKSIIERHDSYDSVKHGVSKSHLKNHDLNLVSSKRPLSSPSSSRTAVTTTPGPVLKQYTVQRQSHKSKPLPPSMDSAYSDTEYIQQKQQNGSFQHMSANKYPYMTSPMRQRDVSSRLSSYADIGGYGTVGDGQTPVSHYSMSPWLQRQALALQRNAMTEAESMESLKGPLSLDSSYFLTRQHCQTSRPNSTTIRMRETASASPGFNASPNRSKDQFIRNGSLRMNKNSEQHSPTSFVNTTANHDSGQPTSVGMRSTAINGKVGGEELVHGSSLSLVSSSSQFSSAEDKGQHEIRKLRRDLDQANEKVSTLTSQLTTNAHMVSAFEQSLWSMTARLQQLSASSEMKDSELERLRTTIDRLKAKQTLNGDNNHSHSPKHSNNSGISRQLSVESVSSVESGVDGNSKSKKKSKTAKILNTTSPGWLRSSFNKAFKKNKSGVKRDALSDAEVVGNGSGNEGDSSSVPNSPLMSSRPFRPESKNNDLNESEMVQELKRQLREKEMVLTDLRLESLTSAHQLENLKETVTQLRTEMVSLKHDNERLNRLVTSKSLASSQSSMTSGICLVGQNCLTTNGSTFSSRQSGSTGSENEPNGESLGLEAVTNALLCDGGKLVTVGSGNHIIASLVVTPKTNWDQLDLMIKQSFKEHIHRIDSGSGLGLTLEALECYQVGNEKIERQIAVSPTKASPPAQYPELLPFGYLVNENHIYLQFKCATDSMVFDTIRNPPPKDDPQ